MIILILKKLFKWKTVAYIAYNSAVCIQALMYYVNLCNYTIVADSIKSLYNNILA